MNSFNLKIAIVTLALLKSTSLYASVYHMLESTSLNEAYRTGYVINPSLKKEGFTHCVKKNQILQIANKYYLKGKDILLIEIDQRKLSYPLRFDYVSSYRDFFPHIYGPINITAITRIYKLKRNTQGQYVSATEVKTSNKASKNVTSPSQVSSTQFAPFSCNEGDSLIMADLERQCAAMKMRLAQYRILSCTPAGDDGGYVNYFSIDASGYCM